MLNVSRLLNPLTNAPGYMAAAGAVYAAVAMIYNAMHHHGVINTAVIIAAVGAVAALGTRQVVTPTRDPRLPGAVVTPAPPPPTPPAPA